MQTQGRQAVFRVCWPHLTPALATLSHSLQPLSGYLPLSILSLPHQSLACHLFLCHVLLRHPVTFPSYHLPVTSLSAFLLTTSLQLLCYIPLKHSVTLLSDIFLSLSLLTLSPPLTILLSPSPLLSCYCLHNVCHFPVSHLLVSSP